MYFCLGRFISPIVGELSKKYPNVATYKIDIDQVWNIFNSVMYGFENFGPDYGLHIGIWKAIFQLNY